MISSTISLNLADLLNVTRLNRIIPGANAQVLNDAWLVGSIHHRSGGKGLFGKYEDENGDKHDITGGDNLFVLGVQVEF